MQSDEELREVIIRLSSKSETPVSYRIIVDDSGNCRIPDVALAMLEEDEPEAVNAALIVMRHFGRGRGKEYLEKAMSLLDQPSYAENVMELIRWYGDSSYVTQVIKFLSYPMAEIRIAAIQTIERFSFGSPELHETALAMINDPDENLRCYLVNILKRSKESRIIHKLISMMYNDESEIVRIRTAYCLKYNNDPEGRRVAEAWLESHEGKA